jgi:hypothetical protein
MANDLKIAVVLSAVDRMSSVINSATSRSIKNLNEFSKTANIVADKAFNIGTTSGAIGLAMAAPIGLAINAAAEYEKMQISLNTAFQGNKKAAEDAFKTINKFAAQTPYELNEVMTGFIKLKNMGLDPSQKAMTAYGNIASGMGKSLNDMVEAVADAATGEFERLKEFGIKASTQGDKVTFLFQGVKTTVGKNSKEIEDYLKKVGNTKFAGGIEAQSKSIKGQMSTLKDSANMVAVKLGNTLVPMLNKLMATVAPVIEKVMNWIDKNPKLTQTIMLVVAGAAALSLGVAALSFMVGGVTKAVIFSNTIFATAKTVMMLFSGGIQAATVSFKALDTAMKANVIILIISAIAAAAMLIYANWDKIKTFFIDMWEGIKNAFKNAWNWIINLPFMAPVKLIIDNWSKIKAFFTDIWDSVKKKFTDFFLWVDGVPKRMYNAGVNIVKSIWEGIKSFINKPIEMIKNMVTKIREYLPFSPAKVGPLRDIHKIRLVETIAENIKPNALTKAMKVTTAAAMVAITPMTGKTAGSIAGSSSGGASVNYAPTINITGGSPSAKEDFKKMLKDHEKDITKLIEEANRKSNRVKL